MNDLPPVVADDANKLTKPKLTIQRPSIDATNIIVDLETGSNGSRGSHSDRRQSKDSNFSVLSGKKDFKSRASQMFIEFPTQHLRRLNKTEGISSVRREIALFAGITTIHSTLRIYRAKGIYKILWISAAITSVTLLILQTISIMNQFLHDPTVSQVSFIIPEKGLIFPTVTICSYNPVRKSYVEELNRTGEFSKSLLDYLTLSYLEVEPMFTIGNFDEIMAGERDYHNYRREVDPHFTINDFFRKAGFACEDLFKVCAFGGREFNCCEIAFETLTDMGKCFRLDLRTANETWLHYQVQSGVNNGLMIIADFHNEQQMGFGKEIAEESIFANEFETGFRYYVHSNDTIPYLNSEGISVSPGSRCYSAISPNEISLLNENNWGNCSAEWPPGYEMDLPYTSPNCKARCRARFFFDKCNCSPFVFNIKGIYPVCTPYQIYTCLINDYPNQDFYHHHMTNKDLPLKPDVDIRLILPECSECLQECESWKYYTYNSYGQEFSVGALTWLHNRNKSWSAEHIKENFVAFNIFYRDLTYTQYTQKKQNDSSSSGGDEFEEHPQGFRQNAKDKLKRISSFIASGLVPSRKTSYADSSSHLCIPASTTRNRNSSFVDTLIENNLSGNGRAQNFIDVPVVKTIDCEEDGRERKRHLSNNEKGERNHLDVIKDKYRLRSYSATDSPDHKKQSNFIY
uniref:Amiloride-sensitive sodium channel subunit alpha n=1 Tax=Rhabditophanes sp. KR3021 TaxID=114890 RepID=A0AC35U7J1_9BILA